MTDLFDLVGSLRRGVAPPGRFAELYPTAGQLDLAGYLADAVAEAKLHGFLSSYALDVDASTVTPDLTDEATALVLLFAANRVLENVLANTPTHVRYEANGAVYEVDQGSQLLTQRLKDIAARKQWLLDQVEREGYVTSVAVVDAYLVRVATDYFQIGAPSVSEALALGNV